MRKERQPTNGKAANNKRGRMASGTIFVHSTDTAVSSCVSRWPMSLSLKKNKAPKIPNKINSTETENLYLKIIPKEKKNPN